MSEFAPAAPPGNQAGFSRFRAVLALLTIVGLSVGGWLFKDWEPQLLPIRVIEVKGELHHYSSELLQKTLTARLHGGLLTVNLLDLKAAAEDLSWVGRASLRRIWPDRLQVEVEEYRPLARWNQDSLVTAAGIVFKQGTGIAPDGLALLEGDEKRASEVVARYQAWREMLRPIDHAIAVLSVDSRGDWQVELAKGTRLRLGTDTVEERFARFVASAPQLEAAGHPLRVDLRYRNGFAVKWAPNIEPAISTPNKNRLPQSGNRG
ncbi:cell division protein FtsQ [Chromatium weissei]|nr:cell division protein FtsQ [Chromatium weissei]